MKKTVLIRVDANSKIAMGHLRRCHTIAKELKQYGIKVIMLFSDNESLNNLRIIDTERIIDDTIVLNVNYQDLMKEISKLNQIVSDTKANLLLVDSYYITKEYMASLSEIKCFDGHTLLIASLDGLLKQKYKCDILINTDLGREDSKEIDILAHRRLLGTHYSILREQFADCKYIVKKRCKDVFLSTGGTDPYNIRYRLLSRLLVDFKDIGLTFHVVSGVVNNAPELLELEKREKVHLYSNVDNVANIMKKCDIAISAGGTTLYELCAVGIPSISFSLADNQLEQVMLFEEKDLIVYAGDVRGEFFDDTYERIENNMTRLISDYNYRNELSLKIRNVVDSKGAFKIAQCINDSIEERFA